MPAPAMQIKAVKKLVKRIKRSFSTKKDKTKDDGKHPSAAESNLDASGAVKRSLLLESVVDPNNAKQSVIVQAVEDTRSEASSDTLSGSVDSAVVRRLKAAGELPDDRQSGSESAESGSSEALESDDASETTSLVSQSTVGGSASSSVAERITADPDAAHAATESFSSSTEQEEERIPLAEMPSPVSATSASLPGSVPGLDAENNEIYSLTSPASQVQTVPPPEPDVHDPFLADSDSDSSDHGQDLVDDTPPAATEISLKPSAVSPSSADLAPITPPEPLPSPLSASLNLNKAIPPTPSEAAAVAAVVALPTSVPVIVVDDDEEDDEEEEVPEIYLPQLVLPTMFLPIPNNDPLTTLLVKHIPQPERRPLRDISGDWKRCDFNTLVITNNWRALARMARDRIVNTNPEALNLVLDLWYLRLSSLARLRLFNQAAAECTNLFSVLFGISSNVARAYVFDRLLPWELEVLRARVAYWGAGPAVGLGGGGDGATTEGEREGEERRGRAYVDALVGLLGRCRKKAREVGRELAKGKGGTRRDRQKVKEKEAELEVEMWRERGARVCLMLASQLVEMKEYTTASTLLISLLTSSPTPAPALRAAIARVHLQSGHLAAAAAQFALVDADPDAPASLKAMGRALMAAARGEWTRTEETLREVMGVPEVDGDGRNFVAVNNLAVALLAQGRLMEAISVLEDTLQSAPASVTASEPFLFNLSTLYELRSGTMADKKRELLVEVAKWSGDGLKTACLKLPAN